MAYLPYHARWTETRPRKIAPSAAAIAAVLLGAASLGAASPAISNAIFDESEIGVAVGVGLVLLAGSPTLARLRRHGFDAPGLYALATCCFLGLTSLAWLGFPQSPGPGLDQANIADALRVVAAGLFAFGIGAWTLGWPRRPPTSEPVADADIPPLALLVTLFAVSIIGTLIAISLGTFGYSAAPVGLESTSPFSSVLVLFSAMLALAPTLGNLVVLITAMGYFRTRQRPVGHLLLAIVVVQICFGFASGFKGNTIMPIVFVLVAYALVRRRLPWRALTFVALFLFFVILPLNQEYRDSVRGAGAAPSAALRQAITTPPELNPTLAATSTVNYVFTRFRSIDSVALIRTQTPSPFSFAGGEKYWLLPAMIAVPRSVWPNKPVLDDTVEFTHTYSGRSVKIRSSTQITQIGDLYRNFGYGGVVIGMFLWGVVVAALAAAYIRWHSPRLQAIYAFVVVTIVVSVESTLPLLLNTAAKTLPLAAVVAWLLLPGRTNPPAFQRLRRDWSSGIPVSQRS